MWLTAGYEVNGTVLWSQPELVLYDRNRTKGHGYPDLITDTTTGAVYITEAYKLKPYAEAKTHPIVNKEEEEKLSEEPENPVISKVNYELRALNPNAKIPKET